MHYFQEKEEDSLMQTLTKYLRQTMILLTVITIFCRLGYGQSLDKELQRKVVYVPSGSSPLEQLIDVAKSFKIPMGIEWTGNAKKPDGKLTTESNGTVRELISSILGQNSNYGLKIEDGVLHISRPIEAQDPKNFLNFKISDYSVQKANTYAAGAALRMKILMQLHPEQFARGWNGGYGFGPDRGDGFDVPNITINAANRTVRELLDMIIRANGNGLWVVRLNPTRLMKKDPFFVQEEISSSRVPVPDFYWRFIPFGKIRSDK